MLKDFRAFVVRGNVMDLAIGIVVGAAFGAVVKSFVDDIIMPPIGLLSGSTDFNSHYVLLKAGSTPPPYATPAAARAAGAVTLNYGAFLGTIFTLIIVAAAVFALVRAVNRLYAKPALATPITKACPYCTLAVALSASRCPHCTSQLGAA